MLVVPCRVFVFGHYETCPCNIKKSFSVVKNENFIRKILIFFYFCSKHIIVGTRKNRLADAVLTSTYNLCFGARIRK